MQSPLISWLYSCNKIVRKSDLRPVTHFMLDGGKLDLTEDYETFQEIYAKNINHKNCIVELKTEFFKLFIDFDVLCKEDFDIIPYTNFIQDTILNIYNIKYRCIITKANKDKDVKRDDVNYIKKGYHFHWPDIVVDKETALRIRKYIVIRLTTEYGKVSNFYSNWENIIDKSVYAHNGLRLVYADKCSISDGTKYYENRVYIVESIHDDKKSLEDYSIIEIIKETSIRTDSKEITNYKNLPEYETEEDSSNFNTSGFDNIKKDCPVFRGIEDFFKNFATGYKVQDIRKIIKIKEKEVYIIESKSKYCQNIQDFHTNNHIFFKLTPYGMCQKCRSERTTERCCCREYSSNIIPISPTLRTALGWEKPKTKTAVVKDYSISNILERLENNITGKPSFSGPFTKSKRK